MNDNSVEQGLKARLRDLEFALDGLANTKLRHKLSKLRQEMYMELATFLKNQPVKSKSFLVTWQIDIEAPSALEAAKSALKIQRDTRSIADHFNVRDKKTNSVVIVDLSEGSQ